MIDATLEYQFVCLVLFTNLFLYMYIRIINDLGYFKLNFGLFLVLAEKHPAEKEALMLKLCSFGSPDLKVK